MARRSSQKSVSSTLMRLGLLSLTLIVALGVAGITNLAFFSQPAGAIGDPGLDAKILTNPGIGWTPYQLPAAARASITGRLTSGGPLSGAKAAVEYWRSAQGSALAIMLAQGEGLQSNVAAQQLPIIEYFCGASTQTSPVPGLQNAISASCSTQSANGPIPINIIVDSQGSILMMVFTLGPYPVDATGSITSIASAQFDRLPAPSTSVGMVVLYGLGVLLVAMAVIVYFFRRAKKLEQAAAVPAVGPGFEPGFVGHDPFAQGSPASGLSQQSASPYGAGFSAGAGFGAGNYNGIPATFQPNVVSPGLSSIPGIPGISGIPEAPLPPLTPFNSGRPLPVPQSASALGSPLVNTTNQASEDTTDSSAFGVERQSSTVGWHTDPTNPHIQNYWDGTKWSHQMRWDGTSWT